MQPPGRTRKKAVPRRPPRNHGAGNSIRVYFRQGKPFRRRPRIDPWPLTGHDVASATGPLRAAAASLFDRGGENTVAARITNRLINAAPVGRPMAANRRDGLWRRVVGADPADAADPGTLSAARIFTLCRRLAAEGAYSTLRLCLEKQHDALMVETNGRYWQTLGAGS